MTTPNKEMATPVVITAPSNPNGDGTKIGIVAAVFDTDGNPIDRTVTDVTTSAVRSVAEYVGLNGIRLFKMSGDVPVALTVTQGALPIFPNEENSVIGSALPTQYQDAFANIIGINDNAELERIWNQTFELCQQISKDMVDAQVEMFQDGASKLA